MKIGINARGLSIPAGGARSFLEELLPELVRLDRENRYVIFHNSSEHRGSFEGMEEAYVTAPHRLLWENIILPLAARKHAVDVLLCPKNLVPWFLPRSMRVVSVVLDLLYFPVMGSYFDEYQWKDVAYVRLFLGQSLKRANRIIAISNNTRKDVLRLFDVDPARISTAHLGVSIPAKTDLSEGRMKEVRERYGLTNPYVFYCGSLSPRKNIRRTVDAFATIADKIGHDFVVTGGKSWKDEEVFEAVRRCGLGDRFKKLGHLPPRDMPPLYAAADLFVYPSMYEGFGLPVLEAMACGCPVLTSNTSCIPEVAGEAAILVDPSDTQAIASGMLTILTNREEADRLRREGLARSLLFTWEKTAKNMMSVFNSL